jgi:hypothetical protein
LISFFHSGSTILSTIGRRLTSFLRINLYLV